MKVLLSIKPEFANKIFEGTKKFEFRKSIFKNKNVKTVIVYASSPVQQVIGEFEIEKILNFDLKTLWNLTHDFSGISEDFFYEYFADKDLGYAIKIKKAIKYNKPKNLREEFNLFPPQSFAYLPSERELQEVL
ncbi:ASCH domain-containing protein [Sphingobacterium spiritivorum]|uniref:ASCH domain-containing protein n=1 Tax=Sphingobacterium spiritivorum TaxID=258 RepID=UPI003DA264CF